MVLGEKAEGSFEAVEDLLTASDSSRLVKMILTDTHPCHSLVEL